MATKLTNLKLSDGTEIVVEIDEPSSDGLRPAGLPSPGTIDFRAALHSIKVASGEVLASMQSMPKPPDVCEITFGIKLSATAGVILAKASTEANFAIKMSWSNKH